MISKLPPLVCFAALLTIVAILGTAGAVHAAEVPPESAPGLQLVEEESELEAEECTEAESDEEESCEVEEEDEACPLRSAHAHISEKHDKAKLTIGYTTSEPTPATVQIRSGGTKTFKRYLSQSGVLRFTENAGALHPKVVITIEAVGRDDCPSRRLALHLPR